MNPPLAIDDLTLGAYVDGELEADDELAVQRYLAANPDIAARVMADLAATHALRADGEAPRPTGETVAAAHRLEAALGAQQSRSWLRTAAVLALVFGSGLLLGQMPDALAGLPGQPPAFVQEAMMSHRTAQLRARMASQPEVLAYDAREIRAATNIVLPRVPANWRVTDAQVYPSDEGPSVGLSFQTPQGPISVFAFRTDETKWIDPTTAQLGRRGVAWWQHGSAAYAVIGQPQAKNLVRVASQLAASGAS